jgi:Arc/MetJ-type ribon-helix-helix transcriptional regulator
MTLLTSPPIADVAAPEVVSLAIRRRRRYDVGMTKVAKITISLPPEQVEQARRAVARGEAASVSSYVSSALAAMPPPPFANDDDGDSLAKLVADMQEEFGRPSPEAYAWADEVMRSALRGGSSQ